MYNIKVLSYVDVRRWSDPKPISKVRDDFKLSTAGLTEGGKDVT